jgi:hypothetical protein
VSLARRSCESLAASSAGLTPTSSSRWHHPASPRASREVPVGRVASTESVSIKTIPDSPRRNNRDSMLRRRPPRRSAWESAWSPANPLAASSALARLLRIGCPALMDPRWPHPARPSRQAVLAALEWGVDACDACQAVVDAWRAATPPRSTSTRRRQSRRVGRRRCRRRALQRWLDVARWWSLIAMKSYKSRTLIPVPL